MNQYARSLRVDKTLRARLISIITRRKRTIVEADTVAGVINALDLLAKSQKSLTNTRVYVVGGDGTFNQMLNWALTQPVEKRPKLIPVGGGQFNFMCKFVGLKSTDPSVNLAAIDSGRVTLEAKTWRPVCITDSLSGERRYGAVIGNGILCDFVEWYEEAGKGDLLDVLKLIGTVIADFGKNIIQGQHGRVKPIHGNITIDGKKLGFDEYAGFMAATVPEFMPKCRPFLKSPGIDSFPLYVYWGNFAALAASVPMVWNGWASPLTDLHTFNDSAKRVEIRTKDPRLLLDGDLHRWPTPDEKSSPPRILTVTYGPEIQLLYAV